jgi:hypothetical protein
VADAVTVEAVHSVAAEVVALFLVAVLVSATVQL